MIFFLVECSLHMLMFVSQLWDMIISALCQFVSTWPCQFVFFLLLFIHYGCSTRWPRHLVVSSACCIFIVIICNSSSTHYAHSSVVGGSTWAIRARIKAHSQAIHVPLSHRFSTLRLSKAISFLDDIKKGHVHKYNIQNLLIYPDHLMIPMTLLQWVLDHISSTVASVFHQKKKVLYLGREMSLKFVAYILDLCLSHSRVIIL